MIDQKLFLLIYNLAGKSRLLDFLAIFLANYLGYLLVLSAIIFIWLIKDRRQRMRALLFLALSLLLARGILTELIRYFYHRPRPFLVLDFEPLIEKMNQGALPSGHAAFYFALAGAIFFLNRRSGWYFLIGASAVGFGRVLVGVHWPLDIVIGALAGLLSAYLVQLLFNRHQAD